VFKYGENLSCPLDAPHEEPLQPIAQGYHWLKQVQLFGLKFFLCQTAHPQSAQLALSICMVGEYHQIKTGNNFIMQDNAFNSVATNAFVKQINFYQL
jgi:hypothetical protein